MGHWGGCMVYSTGSTVRQRPGVVNITGSIGAGVLLTGLLGLPAIACAQATQSESAAAEQQTTKATTADASVPDQNGEEKITEIQITGTRIARSGYQAPTPLTVMSAQALLQDTTSANVADTLNTLPVFAQSQSPESGVSGISAATQGLNVLNLRGIGGNRTLTLFDGQRSVPSLFTGEVDVNNFPEQLISRVETVTGGGSAVYGSDAVAGVVNFILDKNFTGFKSEVSGGETTYGDDQNYKVALTGGWKFADGRGHVLLSGETVDRKGVTPGDDGRLWNYSGWGIVVNPSYSPTNGQPYNLVRPQVSLDNATHYGIIVSGPLRGTYFGQGGTPYEFNYGAITNDPWTVGGDWQSTEVRHDRSGTLEPANKRDNLFGRLSYDITDNINGYVQVAWGDNRTNSEAYPEFQAGNGPTILSGNPFIPTSVQAQMNALGLSSFQIGSMNYNLPDIDNVVNRTTQRYVIGLDGKFMVLSRPWTWSTYFQYGKSESVTNVYDVVQTDRYAEAVDAVRGPNGTVVCRSTLTDPNNGCIPWDPLGSGVDTQAAANYVTGTSSVDQFISENVYAATIQGEPFVDWAAPVSIALSFEHRDDTAGATPSGGGPWFAGNFQAFNATNSVTEGSLETLIPLAEDLPGLKRLEFNGAVRVTDYKYSGTVETWKLGLVWDPLDAVKFRATRSRDIRAPNFSELFATSNSGLRSAFDPFTNTIPEYYGATAGNPNLKPEKGDTYEVGVVFQPKEWRGFNASIDYWNIKISDAIESPDDNQTLLFCYEGRQDFCNNIQRDSSGAITQVTLIPFNLASIKRSGIDVEISQSLQLTDLISSWKGLLDFRLLGTKYLTATQDDGLGAGPYSILGNEGQLLDGPPLWRALLSTTYSLDGLSASVIARAQSYGYINAEYIQCTSNCPASGDTQQTIENNHVPGFFYLDVSLSYSFDFRSSQLETFLNVRNVLNRAPGIVPLGPTDFTYVSPLSKGDDGFDLLGREFLVGVRLRI